MSSAQLAPGTMIEGYSIVGVARERTGAKVYDATDAGGGAVQLTVHDAACFPSALVLERSLRELRQLQGLEHPRVVKVHACGKLADGGTWEAHATLPGPTLAEHLRQGPFSQSDTLAIAQQIGEALAEAQKVGVIHRNLGADVLFPSPGGIVVAGFTVGAPQGGKSFGPLDAMAPEQVEGKVVDQRTLIYNLAALVQYMLRGRPLYEGTVEQILQAHLAGELPGDLSSTLRRGLAKDPRVRPMMLRQFVNELATGVGAAPDPSVPSSRGWTMFTAGDDASGGASTPPPAEAVPSTRGWTMFMKAQPDEPLSPGAPAASTAPASPPPSAATASAAAPAPASSPVAAAEDAPKPSTRGWTMFMTAAEEAPASASGGTPASASGSATATPAASGGTATATPAAGGEPPKPSARGWTMFTGADAPASEPTPATSAPATSAPAASTPAATAPAPEPPSTPGEAPKPSTRGWTMFTRDEPEPAAAPAPVPAAEPTPPAAEGGEPPSSRGWTMFMEPNAAAAVAAQASGMGAAPPAASGGTQATPAAGSTQTTPAAADPVEPAAGAPKRGWTMFMEAPIDAAAPQAFTPVVAGPEPAAAAPEPADAGASDNRGWTVFGTPSPVAPGTATASSQPTPAATASASAATVVETDGKRNTVMVTPQPQPQPQPAVQDASAGPVASGSVTANPEPEPVPGRGRTIVATGVQATPGDVGGVTGRTVFPASGPGMPDTSYFRRGDIQAERPTNRSTAVDIPAPPRAPAEERTAGGGRPPLDAPPVLASSNAPVVHSSNRTTMLVVGGIVLAGVVVAIALAMT